MEVFSIQRVAADLLMAHGHYYESEMRTRVKDEFGLTARRVWCGYYIQTESGLLAAESGAKFAVPMTLASGLSPAEID